MAQIHLPGNRHERFKQQKEMNMLDKVVLITGASSGIGAGIARELGEAGAKLVLGARRTDRLEALAEEIRARAARC